MSKADLIDSVAETAGITKTLATDALDAVFNGITTMLTTEGRQELRIPGFGTFKVVPRAPRNGRNPQTGEVIQIPGCNVVKFVPAKDLKEAVK